MKKVLTGSVLVFLLGCNSSNTMGMTESEFDQYSSEMLDMSEVIREALAVATENGEKETAKQQICNTYLLNKDLLEVSEKNIKYDKAKTNIIFAKKQIENMLNTPAFNNDDFNLKRDCGNKDFFETEEEVVINVGDEDITINKEDGSVVTIRGDFVPQFERYYKDYFSFLPTIGESEDILNGKIVLGNINANLLGITICEALKTLNGMQQLRNDNPEHFERLMNEQSSYLDVDRSIKGIKNISSELEDKADIYVPCEND